MNRFILQVFYAIFSGIMLATAISNEILPLGSPLIALFALVPLYLAFYSAKSYRESARIFGLQILATHLASSFWLANFHGYGVFTLGASAFGTWFEGFMCGFIAFIYPANLKKNSQARELSENAGTDFKSGYKRILWFTSLWLFWEWAKSTGDMGYPWGTLSMAAYKWRVFAQIADVTGVWGVSALFALANAFFAEVLMLISKHTSSGKNVLCGNLVSSGKMILALFVLSAVYGGFCLLLPMNETKKMNVVLVQQNGDPWQGRESEAIEASKRLTEEKILELKEKGLEADLVLWSEGVLGHSFPGARNYYGKNPGEEGLSEFIKRMGVPFIVGGQANVNPQKRHYSNSAILFDKDGNYSGFYCKMHLVPFAEVIPYCDNPLMIAFMKNFVGLSSGWTPGKQFVLFKIPLNSKKNTATPLEYFMPRYAEINLDSAGKSDSKSTERYITNKAENPDNFVRFTTPICFEDAFNDVCRPLYNMGSEVFLNITNDSWSKTDSSEYQHFIASSYRSIEYRTTLVRCTNSGYSVILNPKGLIQAELPLFEEGALAFSIPIYERKNTVYARCGDWLMYIILFCIALYSICTLGFVQRVFLCARKFFKSFRIVYAVPASEDISETQKVSAEAAENVSGTAEDISEPQKASAPAAKDASVTQKTITKKRTVKSASEKKGAEKKASPKAKAEKTAAKKSDTKKTTATKKDSSSSAKKTSSPKAKSAASRKTNSKSIKGEKNGTTKQKS